MTGPHGGRRLDALTINPRRVRTRKISEDPPMSTSSIDLDRLLKLRLVVARFGEMDVAKWWNTKGQLGRLGSAALRRGFPRTHYFAQARSVFAVVGDRDVEGSAKLRRSAEGRAVPLSGFFSETDDDVALLALGFAKGDVS